MTTEYKHLELWEHPGNYAGPSWDEYYCVAGHHRDSDPLTESNWPCWLKFMRDLLGPESEIAQCAFMGEVDVTPSPGWVVVRESHFAVGWVECIRVHQDCDPAKLAAIDAQLHKLDGYPVMDEDHFSQLEDDERQRIWASDCKRIWHDWLESRIGEKPYELLMSVYPEELECVLNRAFENECMHSGETWAEPAKDYTIGELREDADCGHYGDRYVRLFENLTAAEAANLSDE